MPVIGKPSALARALVLPCILLTALAPLAPAQAELAVSQLIVELKPGSSRVQDVELVNDSEERSYVSVEPREMIEPGTVRERSAAPADPEKLGLLVSPRRMILEPGQRRSLRIASLGPALPTERVYRVTVKPVVGEISGETGLKLLVGYDLLVLVRPGAIQSSVDADRRDGKLVIVNRGNASVELVDGKQCDLSGRSCRELPGKRLYAGASFEQALPSPNAGEYRVRSADGWSSVKF